MGVDPVSVLDVLNAFSHLSPRCLSQNKSQPLSFCLMFCKFWVYLASSALGHEETLLYTSFDFALKFEAITSPSLSSNGSIADTLCHLLTSLFLCVLSEHELCAGSLLRMAGKR